jgi:hypothetical protein
LNDFDCSIRFRSHPSFSSSQALVDFIELLLKELVKKDKFTRDLAVFVFDVLFLFHSPGPSFNLSSFLQRAGKLFLGWTSRWFIFTKTKVLEGALNTGEGGGGGGRASGAGLGGGGEEGK